MSLGAGLGLAGSIAGSILGAMVGGPVGAAIGGAIGGFAGSYAGNLLDPTIVQGPQLNDTKLQRSQYGQPLAYVWGTYRLAGNVDWIGNNGELVAHKQTSGGKGGGPSVENTTYTGSWSVKYCVTTKRGQQAIVAIDKHWADGRVVNESDINPTVYIGWPGQLPDSSMEADLGVGEVSADRFIGKEVYNEVQMDQFFNRLPNMEALIRTKGLQNGPIVQLAIADQVSNFPPYPRLDAEWPIDWESTHTLPAPPSCTATPYTYLEEGVYAHRITYGADVWVSGYDEPVKVCMDHTVDAHYASIGSGAVWPGLMGVPAGSGITVGGAHFDICDNAGVETGRYVVSFCASQDRTILMVITADSFVSPTEWQWHRIVNGTMTDHGPCDPAINHNIGTGNFGDNIHSLVKGVVEPNGVYIWAFQTASGWYIKPVDESVYVIRLLYIDSADNTLKQYSADTGVTSDNYGGPATTGAESGAIYCPGEGYCATVLGARKQYALYTRIGSVGQVTLAEVVGDVLKLGDGLTDDQMDLSQGESTIIDGCCLANQMQKRNFIETLKAAYAFDLIDSDNGTTGIVKLVMRNREPPDGGWPAIPDSDLGVRDDGDAEPKALVYIVNEISQAELPARINVQFIDASLDYQTNSAEAHRVTQTVDNPTTLNLPIVMTASKARVIAKHMLYRAQLERITWGFSTSRAYAQYEESDVVTAGGMDLRITKKTERPSGLILWEGVLNAPFVNIETTDGAPGEGATPPDPPAGKVATTAVFFDAPMAQDSDLDVGFYVAAAPSSNGTWTGFSLQKSTDGGSTYGEIATSSAPAIMGTAQGPLGDFTGGNVFDYSNIVRITMLYGELESISELAALNGGNQAFLGPEQVNFTTADLVSSDPNVYDVSGWLRGRRGTEWAMGKHGPGETFALGPLLNVATPTDEVGQLRYYKAVTFGLTVAGTTAQTFTNTAQSARCYAPVQLAGGVGAGGDELIEFVPRTRKDGAWRDLVDVTQADSPPQYVIEIWDATYTLCARVVSGLSSPSYTYAAADQATDFGSAQSTYYVTAAQVGRFGLGIRARAAIPGSGGSVNDPSDPGNPYDPPVDPPVGGGSVDVTLDVPADVVSSSGFRIGDTYVAKFTTGSEVTGYVSTANVSMPAYAQHIRLCSDSAGTTLIAENYGNPVASISFGTTYAWEVALSPSTDYYVFVQSELPNGDPSGTPGTAAEIGITLFLE